MRMKNVKQYEFWFITGSQHLYGEEVIKTVEDHSKAMVEGLANDPLLPRMKLHAFVKRQTMMKTVQVSLHGVIHSHHQRCGFQG